MLNTASSSFFFFFVWVIGMRKFLQQVNYKKRLHNNTELLDCDEEL